MLETLRDRVGTPELVPRNVICKVRESYKAFNFSILDRSPPETYLHNPGALKSQFVGKPTKALQRQGKKCLLIHFFLLVHFFFKEFPQYLP